MVEFPHVVQTLQGADQFVEFRPRQFWTQALAEFLKTQLAKAWLLQRLGELGGISNIWGTKWGLIFLWGKHRCQNIGPELRQRCCLRPCEPVLRWGRISPARGLCSSPARGFWEGVWPKLLPLEPGTLSSSSCVSFGLCCDASPSNTHGPFCPLLRGPHYWGFDQGSRTGCQRGGDRSTF